MIDLRNPGSGRTAFQETDPALYPDGAATPELTCPECGMPQSDWAFNGQGYERYGETFCCSGCADGTGCTCG